MITPRKFSKGFTLIELLVVIAVLGILAAGVFVAINPLKRIGQANDTKIKSDIGQIAQASQAYYTQNLSYPRTVQQLVDNGDLKTAPKQPGTNADYGITPIPSTCDGTTSNACTEITIEAPLASPQTPNATYQWNSTTNTAGEVAIPTSTPIPSATPTITPTPLPPIILSDDGQTGFWQVYSDNNPGIGQQVWAITSLTNDAVTKTSGLDSLKMIVGSGSTRNVGLIHVYGSSRANWSGYNTITFSWYGANTNATVSFVIQTGPDGTPYTNSTSCSFTDNSTGWTTRTFTISACGGNAILGSIYRILFYNANGLPNGTPSPFTWYVDRVVVSQ